MPYTDVAKPTGSSYTNLAPVGKEFFDDVITTFDSGDNFFDGISLSAYTDISKPTGSSYTSISKPT